jgi:hypothetical protein
MIRAYIYLNYLICFVLLWALLWALSFTISLCFLCSTAIFKHLCHHVLITHTSPHSTSLPFHPTAVLLFLFASQDASTASLVWTLAVMADRPDILARVRAEQYALRGDKLETTLDGELIGQMVFTRQVIKELLRYRAPAPMVPQMAYAPYPISEDYNIPKGTLVFPSVNSACMQGFTEPEKFDPDRFGPDRKEDIVHARVCLVGWLFGLLFRFLSFQGWKECYVGWVSAHIRRGFGCVVSVSICFACSQVCPDSGNTAVYVVAPSLLH